MVAHLSDDEIYALNRGGHDPFKVFQAYRAAKKCSDKPTVILAKTVKGYGMGEAGEGQNTTHSQKKLGLEQVAKFAERFDIPVTHALIKP
jgi:pyruvate dehydrogenase E1 component